MGQCGRQNQKPMTMWQQLLTFVAISFVVIVFGTAAIHSIQVLSRELSK